jgi:hypothetical protein
MLKEIAVEKFNDEPDISSVFAYQHRMPKRRMV